MRATDAHAVFQRIVCRKSVPAMRLWAQKYSHALNQEDKNGYTPLLLAVQARQLDLVMELCNHPTARAPNSHGFNALMQAVELGDVEAMAALFPFFELREKDRMGYTALCWAAFEGQVLAAQWLIEQYQDPQELVHDASEGWEWALASHLGPCAKIQAVLSCLVKAIDTAEKEEVVGRQRHKRRGALLLGAIVFDHLPGVSLLASADNVEECLNWEGASYSPLSLAIERERWVVADRLCALAKPATRARILAQWPDAPERFAYAFALHEQERLRATLTREGGDLSNVSGGTVSSDVGVDAQQVSSVHPPPAAFNPKNPEEWIPSRQKPHRL